MEGLHRIQTLDTELLRAIYIAFPHATTLAKVEGKWAVDRVCHSVQLPSWRRKVLRDGLSSPELRVPRDDKITPPAVGDVHVVDLAHTVHGSLPAGDRSLS